MYMQLLETPDILLHSLTLPTCFPLTLKKKKKKCKIKSHLIFYNYPCQKKIVKESGG